MNLQLKPLSGLFAVCRLDPNEKIPPWAIQNSFFSITRTPDELSIVCTQSELPNDVKAEKEWRCLKVRGPLDFALTGVLSSILNPLAKAKISIFAVSTFETDYILIKDEKYNEAISTLSAAGVIIDEPDS